MSGLTSASSLEIAPCARCAINPRYGRKASLHSFSGTAPWAGVFTLLLCVITGLTSLTVPATAATALTRKPSPMRIKGSFVIAAVCKDGIIVASDSRGTLKDNNGRRLAYYDVNQKIFPMGNSLIADTGYASLDDPKLSFLSALMLQFAANERSHARVDQLPFSYFKYVDQVLPAEGAQSAKTQTLVFAGFDGAKPILCLYRGETSGKTSCRFSGYVSSPRKQITGLEKVGSLSFQQAATIMRKTIDDYATAISPGPVGGPVAVRVLTPSKSEWWGQHPDWPHWNSFADLANDYRSGRVSFQLMPGVNRADLDTLVDQGAAWAHSEQVGSP